MEKMVYVKVQHSYVEYGEVVYGELLGIFDSEEQVKKDKEKSLKDAQDYINSKKSELYTSIRFLQQDIDVLKSLNHLRALFGAKAEYQTKMQLINQLENLTDEESIEYYLVQKHIEYIHMQLNKCSFGKLI